MRSVPSNVRRVSHPEAISVTYKSLSLVYASMVESGEKVRLTAPSGFIGKSAYFSGALTPVRRLPVEASATNAVLSVNVPSYVNMTSLLSSHFHPVGTSLNFCASIGNVTSIAAIKVNIRFAIIV